MADSAVVITAGTGTNIDTRTEATNGNHRQVVVLGDPATNAGIAPVDATAGLKVDLGADNDVTLATLPDTSGGDLAALSAKDFATQTTLAAVKAKTDNIPALGQALAAASVPVVLTAAQITTLTPPTPQTDALTDTQLRATAVPISVATIPSHAVTNAGTFAVQADTELTTGDLDTGAGTDTRAVIGLVGSKSGGGEIIPGSAADGLLVNLGTNNDVVVSATDLDIRNLTNTDVVTAELSATDNAVLDAIAASLAGTLTVTGGGGGTEYTEDAAAAANPVGNAMILVREDARAGSLTTTDGDNVAARGNNKGEQYVKDTDAGALLTTIDADTGNISTKIDTLAGAVAGTEMQVDVLTMPTVTVNAHAVTNAGTFATQVDGNALTALQLIDDPVFADDAAYTLGTSKGQVIQGIAVETDGTDPTTVSAEGDAASLRTDRQRLLIVNQTHPRGFTVSADYASAQTNASVKAAPGASLSIYITDITISNGATAGNVTLLDGSGGTVLYEIYPAINGGVDKQLRQPIKLTANTALCITSTTVTTHSIFIGGYVAP